VSTIRAREYAATQEGTLHFHYLLTEYGGLLHMADTLDEHVHALSGSLSRTRDDETRLRNFVEGFVRPQGLDVAATPLLADAVEQLAQVVVTAPPGTPMWQRVLRSVLYRVATRMKTDRPAAARDTSSTVLEKKRVGALR
jgi:hypothetical protein